MKILFVAPYLPSTIRARSLNFIKGLAARGHSITLVALSARGERPSEVLASLCDRIVAVPGSKVKSILNCVHAMVSGDSLWMASCRSEAVSRAVAEVCGSEDFDVLHVEHIRATSYVKSCKAAVTVFDSVDCMGPLLHKIAKGKRNPLIRAVLRTESGRVGLREADICSVFDKAIITSERERSLMLDKAPAASIDVVPIGVDIPELDDSRPVLDPKKLIFTGKISYFPNADSVTWFAREVFPQLAKLYPEVSLTVAGAEPPADIRKLGLVPGITITGFVPDLKKLLQESGIAICPLRIAAGAQFKVIEAMACALPVVASPLAARTVEGCDSVVVADTPEEWAHQISRLIDNPIEASELGSRNRAYVVKNYSWQSAVDKLEAVYRELLERRK